MGVRVPPSAQKKNPLFDSKMMEDERGFSFLFSHPKNKTLEIGLHKTSETEGIIKINLSREDFQPAVDQKVKELSKTVNLKGFRPGKVPAGMIRKLYGTSLIVEQLNKVVSGQLNDYL